MELLKLSESNAPVAVFLCDRTGVAARPWAEAGFLCYCVDTQHSIRRDRVEGNIRYVWGDVRSWCPPPEIRGRIVFGAGFPPCTDVTSSDARDFVKKGLHKLTDSLETFAACERAFAWAGCPYFVENPRGVISTHYRKPDASFEPWHFGDLWTKTTYLWTGGGFVMPEPVHREKPEGVTQKIWLMPPSDERANLRSETPAGFSRAVFEANAPALLARVA